MSVQIYGKLTGFRREDVSQLLNDLLQLQYCILLVLCVFSCKACIKQMLCGNATEVKFTLSGKLCRVHGLDMVCAYVGLQPE